MFSNTSIASNLWAVTMAHFAPWTKVFSLRRREPGRFDIKALHVVLALQASDVEGLYICAREVG